MQTVESLPSRPLTTDETESIGAAPYSGMPALDRIYAIMMLSDEMTHALGFDEDRESWVVIESVDRDLEGEATKRIDTAVNEWIENTYSERYEQMQAEV